MSGQAKPNLRILYVGNRQPGTTSLHRATALQRLGHSVVHLDPYAAMGRRLLGWEGKLHYHTGYRLLSESVRGWLGQVLDREASFDLSWVDNGELLDAEAVSLLRRRCGAVGLFNQDDPTGTRDGARFATLRRAIAAYDLCLVVREANVAEFCELGARDVLRVWMGYDEVAHRPDGLAAPTEGDFTCDVAFIGRNFKGESRDRLLVQLLESGLSIAIWGSNWNRSRYWRTLQPHFRGLNIIGMDYVNAIRGARICLGLLSSGNRDQHTTRSMEIPYAGGLLCAQRTPEHDALYRDGVEACFWSNAAECVDVCKRLVSAPLVREGIRVAGTKRVVQNRVGNEDLARTMLNRLLDHRSSLPGPALYKPENPRLI